MRKLLAAVATGVVFVVLGFAMFVYAQDQQQPTLSQWEIVTLPEFENTPSNYSGVDPKPVVSGLLYDRMAGPDGGVYALIVTATCVSESEESNLGRTCSGYQWTTEVAPFAFD